MRKISLNYAKIANRKICVFCMYWNGNANVDPKDLQRTLSYDGSAQGTCSIKKSPRSAENTCENFKLDLDFLRYVWF
jgi:hypothetical protein